MTYSTLRPHCAASLAALALALAYSGPALAQDSSAAPSTAQPGASGETDTTIIVTGSRLARSGFDQPTPVTVVGSEQINRQGASNVAEVLNDIPAFRPQSTPSTTAIFINNIGASTADLRGLGANRTLVLINGRRVVPATVSGSSYAPAGAVDLNMVPTSLISRADVVTGGASAAYGSDAVAGVVNLILDTRLEGVRAKAQYGFADAGDDLEVNYSLAAGSAFAGGRGHIIAGIDYVNDAGTGDCYSRDWCSQSYNTISNPYVDALNPSKGRVLQGSPATLILPNARVATATINGQVIAGPLRGLEARPDGTTFQHDYGAYYGSGIFQSGGGDPELAFYQNFPISSPSKRVNALTHAEFELSSALKLFAEASVGKVTANTIGAQRRDLGPRTILRSNPFVPAAVAARMDQFALTSIPVARIWNDIGPVRGEVNRNTYRAVGGLEAKFGNGWSAEAYYQFGRTDYDQTGRNTTVNSRMAFAIDAVTDPVTGKPVCRAVLLGNPAAAGCQPLNIFGNGSPSQAARQYVTATARQSTQLTQNVVSATVRGNLLDLWAGPLAVAAGGEFRKDIARGTADPISTRLDFYTSPGSPISGSVSVWEGFVEAALPLFTGAELNGAVRVTDYSTSGSVTTWKVGADYAPFDWLRLRGTRSRDIRAPNIFELFGPQQTSFQSVVDKNGTQYLASVLLGGNSGLQPEKADTWTAGVVLQPQLGPGRLRASVDYYDISLKNAVSTLGAQIIVTGCNGGNASLCALVTRDSTGAITQVVNSNINLGSLITRGWDVEVAYTLPAFGGDLSLRGLATIVDDLITVDANGVGIDRANMNGSPVSQPSGLPRYTINGYLTYNGDPFELQLQVRHISPGAYNTALVGPGDKGYDPNAANSVSDNHIGAWTYVNLNGGYEVWRDGEHSVKLFGAVANLFDKDPPVDAPSSFGPTNNVLYDVVGRTYRFGLQMKY